MKSERRHELQRNVLEVEIQKVWEFLKRRGNLLAWVGLGAAAVILGIVWYVRTSRSDTEQLQAQFDRLIVPTREVSAEVRQTGLEKIAENKSQPLWAANADVALGDLFFLQLATQWPSLSDGQRSVLRDRAKGNYDRAISDFPKETSAVAKAHYGLGKLAECWGDVDAAKREYEEALANEGALRGQPIREVALIALARLGQFQGTVYMPASAPATAPASGPSTRESQPASGSAPASAPAGSAVPSPVSASRPASSAAPASASAPAKSD